MQMLIFKRTQVCRGHSGRGLQVHPPVTRRAHDMDDARKRNAVDASAQTVPCQADIFGRYCLAVRLYGGKHRPGPRPGPGHADRRFVGCVPIGGRTEPSGRSREPP